MNILLALLPFSFIASFTPGPNNIVVMSHGINRGFRSTLPYQYGAGIACFIILFVVLILGAQLERLIPAIIPAMKYLGCAYMLYLALIIARSKPDITDNRIAASCAAGFVMQFINPKFYLYTLTLAANLIPIIHDSAYAALYSLFFAGMAVAGMLAWALAGALLQNFLRVWYKAANLLMAAALVWCAISLLSL